MAYEIEHKYLVKNDSFKEIASKRIHIIQGYLSSDPDRVVRIRIFGEKGFITVKGRTLGDTRLEFEYEIPLEDAESMIELCQSPVIEKYRYIVESDDHVWEIDEFAGLLSPLVTAEIELSDSSESYSLPGFIGENVTGNPAYYNSELVKAAAAKSR